MPVEMAVSDFTLDELKEFQSFLTVDLQRKPSLLVSRMKELVEDELKRRANPPPSPSRRCRRGQGLKDPN